MPSGHDERAEEFARLDAPLGLIDKVWYDFAIRIGGSISKMCHNRPVRRTSLTDRDGFDRSIALTPVTHDLNGRDLGVRYMLDVGAYYDKETYRHSWTFRIAKLTVDEVTPEKLVPLLEQAWDQLRIVDRGYVRAHGQTAERYRRDPNEKVLQYPRLGPDDPLPN